MGVGPVIINAISTLHLIFQAWQRNQLLMNFLEVTMTPLLRIDKVNVHWYCDVINDYWNINNTGMKKIIEIFQVPLKGSIIWKT